MQCGMTEKSAKLENGTATREKKKQHDLDREIGKPNKREKEAKQQQRKRSNTRREKKKQHN